MSDYKLSRQDDQKLTKWIEICHELTDIAKTPYIDHCATAERYLAAKRLRRPDALLLICSHALANFDDDKSVAFFAERTAGHRQAVLALPEKALIEDALYTSAAIIGQSFVRREINYSYWGPVHEPREREWLASVASIGSRDKRIDAYQSLLFIGGGAPKARCLAAKHLLAEIAKLSPLRQAYELELMMPLLPEGREETYCARKLFQRLKNQR